MAKDPTCGMFVEEKENAIKQELEGIQYHLFHYYSNIHMIVHHGMH